MTVKRLITFLFLSAASLGYSTAFAEILGGNSWATKETGGGSGDITGITAGTGLTGGGTSGTPTLSIDPASSNVWTASQTATSFNATGTGEAYGIVSSTQASLVIEADSVKSTFTATGLAVPGLTVGSVGFAETLKRQITVTLDGGGSVLTTGAKDIGVRVPYNMTLTGWEIKSYPAASTATVKVDIWKDVFANWPPTSTDSIVGSSTPTLTSSHISSGTCSGWTTSLTAGDQLDFSILAGVAVSTRTVLNLYGTVR